MEWAAAGSFTEASRTPSAIDSIVLHTTEGRYVEAESFAANQARNYLGNVRYFRSNDRKVSAHFVVGPGGELTWMVAEEDIAHTQTYYNRRAIGIECAGWGRDERTWTPELLDTLVELCAYLCERWEVVPEHPEGTAQTGPWSRRTAEGEYRFEGTGLVGHDQVQPWNKSDPGPHFPWDEFCERVRARLERGGP